MADDSIVGAWELVSDSRVGVSIYTDSHFSTVMAPKNRQRSSGERATPGEALEALLTCQALSGTYAVSGSTGNYTKVANTRAETSDQPVVYALGDTRPVWRALVGMAGDSTQHTGQIAYLRGMFTGMGWRRRAGWY